MFHQAAIWIAWTFPELVQGAYFEGAVIDHINTDRADNRPENLRWCTPKENSNNPLTLKHISEALLNHPAWSRTVNQYDLEGTLIATYPSVHEAARRTGGNMGNIATCCRGEKKTSGGFMWKYEEREAS